MNQEQKAEKVRLQTMFGELMWQTFANLIALHRWRRVEAVRRLRDSEEQNKRRLQEAVAKVLQQSDQGNKDRLKAFSAWLLNADITSSEDVILLDWWNEMKRRGQLRSPVTYG